MGDPVPGQQLKTAPYDIPLWKGGLHRLQVRRRQEMRAPPPPLASDGPHGFRVFFASAVTTTFSGLFTTKGAWSGRADLNIWRARPTQIGFGFLGALRVPPHMVSIEWGMWVKQNKKTL